MASPVTARPTMSTPGGSGQIQLRLTLPEKEVELSLGRGFALTPRSAGQLLALPGVLSAERI